MPAYNLFDWQAFAGAWILRPVLAAMATGAFATGGKRLREERVGRTRTCLRRRHIDFNRAARQTDGRDREPLTIVAVGGCLNFVFALGSGGKADSGRDAEICPGPARINCCPRPANAINYVLGRFSQQSSHSLHTFISKSHHGQASTVHKIRRSEAFSENKAPA